MTTSSPTQEDGTRSTTVGVTQKAGMPMISFDRDKFNRLQITYDQAVAEGQKLLTFEGYDYVTNYAKYVLQYLDRNLV